MSNNSEKIIVTDRKIFNMNGVENVLGFDENYISLAVKDCIYVIEGSELKISALTREQGEITVTGNINAMFFDIESTKKKFKTRGKHS